MKTILVINSEMHNDKHVCCIEDEIKCPLWNNDRYICQYCLNTNTKDCPLKPMPQKKNPLDDCGMFNGKGIQGYNACIDEILGGNE